jgi:hypothetical protein
VASEVHSRTPEGLAPTGEEWELLHRIGASVAFQKSNRLREFLLYVGKRKLEDPQCSIPEQEIGVAVFGRPVGYDTGQDNLVRVQASQLRKKLQQYFAAEGRDESIVVELPKGGYAPVFHAREVPAPGLASLRVRRSTWVWAGWGLAGVLGLALLLLLVQNLGLRQRAELGMGARPAVDRLWRQMFGNGQPISLVLADGNLVEFENQIQSEISLSDYENGAFAKLVQPAIADPAVRTLALSLVSRRYTSVADVKAALAMGLVSASNGLPLEVVFARYATTAQVSSHNAILLGSLRANPWVGLFEDKLNFRTVFEESPRAAYFVNRSPRPGELPEYREEWGKLGFCRVAYLPNPKATGDVLLVSGTDVQVTEAGSEFITSERWVRALRTSLRLKWSDPVPHFEALLEGQLINATVPQFQVVVVRRH